MGRIMVESVLCYGSELWILNADLKRRLIAVEMDYLRRGARISRIEKKTNDEVRARMNANETVIDRIERKSLKWYGHMLRMPDHRWPRKVYEWKPPGRHKRGRPRRSWTDQINELMEHRSIHKEDALDKEAWQRITGIQQNVVIN